MHLFIHACAPLFGHSGYFKCKAAAKRAAADRKSEHIRSGGHELVGRRSCNACDRFRGWSPFFFFSSRAELRAAVYPPGGLRALFRSDCLSSASLVAVSSAARVTAIVFRSRILRLSAFSSRLPACVSRGVILRQEGPHKFEQSSHRLFKRRSVLDKSRPLQGESPQIRFRLRAERGIRFVSTSPFP